MSSRPPQSTRTTPSPLVSENYVVRALTDPSLLSELVKELMELQRDDARRLLGDTSKSGLRKAHEHVTSAIDISLSILRRSSGAEISGEDAAKISLMLSRTLIFVKYQQAREQLDGELPKLMEAMIKRALDATKPRGNKAELEKILESARTLADALLVLGYTYLK